MKYQETLKFSHPLIWLLMLPLILFFGYALVQQLILGQPVGSKPAPDHWLLIFALIPLLVTGLLALARLELIIDEAGIHYRFFPFHLRVKTLYWESIEKVALREYNALKEFGGWGIRINFSGNKAYNVMGDGGQGLEVVRKDGRKILFSVRNPQVIKQFLNALSSKGRGISLHN